MNSSFLLGVISLFALVTGCASPLKPNATLVEFDSSPAGATISTSIKTFAVAPQKLYWELNAAGSTVTSEPITARWVSGATTTTTIILNGGQSGAYYLLNRPQGVAGLETDVRWAMHLQNAKQQADNAAVHAFIAMQPRAPISTSCTQIGINVSCTSK